MGQKSSCLSGSEDTTGARNHSLRMNADEQYNSTGPADQPRKEIKSVPAPYKISKTVTTEYSPDWRESEKDKDCGYNLVDLKGDKIDHTDTTTLVGCEVSWCLMHSPTTARTLFLRAFRYMPLVSALGSFKQLSARQSTTSCTKSR
jgi:hypothetical protein